MHLHLTSTKFPDSTFGAVGAAEEAAWIVEAYRPGGSGIHPPHVALPRVLALAPTTTAASGVLVMDGPPGRTEGGRGKIARDGGRHGRPGGERIPAVRGDSRQDPR